MRSPGTENWNPEQYASNARFVSELGAPVVALLAPQPGERVLDLGCGDGALTMKLLEAGCEVVGVDASEAMVAAARARGLEAMVADARELPLKGTFDAVFSNAALHWIGAPHQVIQAVRRALKPGGRFVGEFGGCGNVTAIVSAIQAALEARGHEVDNPWYFPGADEYRALLEGAAFAVDSLHTFDRPTPLPGELADWLATFGHPFFSNVPAGWKEELINEIVENLRSDLCDEQGVWWVDYVRLRFAAVKKVRGT